MVLYEDRTLRPACMRFLPRTWRRGYVAGGDQRAHPIFLQAVTVYVSRHWPAQAARGDSKLVDVQPALQGTNMMRLNAVPSADRVGSFSDG